MSDFSGGYAGSRYSRPASIFLAVFCIGFAIACFVGGIPAAGVVFVVLAVIALLMAVFGPRIRSKSLRIQGREDEI